MRSILRRLGPAVIAASAPSRLPAAQVWQAIAQVETWPDRCDAVVHASIDGPLEVGASVRLQFAGVRPATWTVERVEEGRRIVLRTAGPGFAARGEYAVDPDGDGCVVRAAHRITGSMAWPVVLIVRRPTVHALRRWVRAVADGAGPSNR